MASLRLALALSFALAACGGSSTSTHTGGPDAAGGGGGNATCSPVAGSCTNNDQSGCEEYTVDLSGACTSGGTATWSSSGCSHTDAVAGCITPQQGTAPCHTNWFYASSGATPEVVMSYCSQVHGTYLTP